MDFTRFRDGFGHRHVPWNRGKLLGHTNLQSTVRYLGIEVMMRWKLPKRSTYRAEIVVVKRV